MVEGVLFVEVEGEDEDQNADDHGPEVDIGEIVSAEPLWSDVCRVACRLDTRRLTAGVSRQQ